MDLARQTQWSNLLLGPLLPSLLGRDVPAWLQSLFSTLGAQSSSSSALGLKNVTVNI